MANGLFAGGNGTELNPYLIEDAHDLNAVRNGLDKHYKLINDIDLNISPYNEGEGWIPIANFTGVINGNKKIVSNLFIRKNAQYAGLIANCNGMRIYDLGLVNVDIEGTSRVGAFVGYFAKQGNTRQNSIQNCYSTGRIVGTSGVGGIAGHAYYQGTIKNCYSTVDLTFTTNYGGGICGLFQGSTYDGYPNLSKCFFNGKINGNSTKGGLIALKDTEVAMDNTSFWDIDISLVATSALGIGKTTNEMKMAQTFINAGWNTELNDDGKPIWLLDDGAYPKLWFEVNENNITNLALYKPVTVNSEHPSYLKENTVDGRNSTHWVSLILGSVRNSWCIVDLGDIYKINTIELVVKYGCTIFDIEISKDGVTYDVIEKDLPININSTKSFQINGVIGRFVKISNIGTSYSGSANQGLAELRVFGEEPKEEIKYLIKFNNELNTILSNETVLIYPNVQSPLNKSNFEEYGLSTLIGYKEEVSNVKYEMSDTGNLEDGKVYRKIINKKDYKINSLEVIK